MHGGIECPITPMHLMVLWVQSRAQYRTTTVKSIDQVGAYGCFLRLAIIAAPSPAIIGAPNIDVNAPLTSGGHHEGATER